MSIRGDRGPRDQMAMPAEPSNKRESGYRRTGRYGRGPGDQRRYDRYGDSGGGLGGLLKFLLFLVVLAGLVLVALVTVARPIARLAVVALAEDNPSALKIGFVADFVREDIGDTLTAPAKGTGDEIVFTVASGDTPATLAPKLLEAGVIDSERAFLFEARTTDLATQARRRALQPRRQPDAGPGGHGPRRQSDRDDLGPGDLPRGPPAGADHGAAHEGQHREPHGGRPGRVLQPRDQAHGRAAGRLPVAARRRTSGPRGRRSRASCTRPRTTSGPTGPTRPRPTT